MFNSIHKVSGWVWTIIVGLGVVVALVVGIIDFWQKIEGLVQGSVKAATIQITQEVQNSEHKIGGFFVDDLRDRIIVIEDSIGILEDQGKPIPRNLQRQHQMIEERLEEAKEKWEK